MPRFLTSLSLILMLSACTPDWQTASFDSSISQNPEFRKLHAQPEVFSAMEDEDLSKKRTSGVAFLRSGNPDSYNNCRAFFKGDTLCVDIGYWDGYTASGFTIRYLRDAFSTKPCYSTDVIDPEREKPSFEVLDEQLVLDKASYATGDSIFGHIALKTRFTDELGIASEQSAKGFFRSRIGPGRS